MSSMKRWWSGFVVLVMAGVAPAVRAETSASPLADDPTLIALAVALACSDAPEAVEAPPQGPSGPAASGPEVELVATVRAKNLRFDEVPKVDVVFHGTGRQRTVWKTERVNLPVHPQPGVTYHDVQVRLTISSDLEELSSMLREAKRASRGIRIEDAAAAAPAAAAPKVADPPKAAPAAPAVKAAAAAPPAPAAPAANAAPSAPAPAAAKAVPAPAPPAATQSALPAPVAAPAATSPSATTAGTAAASAAALPKSSAPAAAVGH